MAVEPGYAHKVEAITPSQEERNRVPFWFSGPTLLSHGFHVTFQYPANIFLFGLNN